MKPNFTSPEAYNPSVQDGESSFGIPAKLTEILRNKINLGLLQKKLADIKMHQSLTDLEFSEIEEILAPYLMSGERTDAMAVASKEVTQIVNSDVDLVVGKSKQPYFIPNFLDDYSPSFIDIFDHSSNASETERLKLAGFLTQEDCYQLLLLAKDQQEIRQVISIWAAYEFGVGKGFSPDFLIQKAKFDHKNRDKILEILDYLRTSHILPIQVDLNELYEEIDFEKYELSNELQDVDDGVVDQFVKEGDTVLDVGCGTGRMEEQFLEQGAKVFALDPVKKHIYQVSKKYQASAEQVVPILGDWSHIPDEVGQVDTAVILGRTLLHNLSKASFAIALENIVKHVKTGGHVIFDIPDSEVGEYQQKLMDTHASMGSMYSWAEPGLIYDGPDDDHMFWRRVPSNSEIEFLAKFLGLKPAGKEAIFKSTPLGKTSDINNYYVFQISNKSDTSIEEYNTGLQGYIEYLYHGE